MRTGVRWLVAAAALMLFTPSVAGAASTGPAVGHWAAMPDINGHVALATGAAMTMAKAADGKMYIGGSFTDAGGDPTADYLAVYDPVTHDWSGLGSNGLGDGALNSSVWSIALQGDKVYVTGSFTNAGGVAEADYFAVWNGSSWSTRTVAGAPFNGAIESISIGGGNIYVGGAFTDAGGDPLADNVAVWNGSMWTHLASAGAVSGSINDTVTLVKALPDGRVMVGGAFASVEGDTAAARLAWFDTATHTWHGFREAAHAGAAIANGVVWDVLVSGTKVYAAGAFTDVSGIAAADGVAMWNGTAWTALGSNGAGDGALNNSALSIQPYGNTVVVSGWFTDAGGNAAGDCAAAWNGTSWLPLGAPAVGATCLRNRIDGSSFTVGGSFVDLAGISGATGIAQYGLPVAPASPTALAATRPATHRVRLAWTAPATNGTPLVDYQVQYRRSGTTAWTTLADGVSITRTATVNGLVSGARYSFRVRARNAWIWGPFTTAVSATVL